MSNKKNDRTAAPGRVDPAGGEGNVAADRRYRAGVERSVAEGDTDKLAKEAADALDGPEGAALHEAEEAARGGHAMGGHANANVPEDLGYGKSHGYGPSHGGPSGPGDAPALPAERRDHR